MGCTLAGPPLGQSPAAFLEFHLGARPRLPSPRRGGRPAPQRSGQCAPGCPHTQPARVPTGASGSSTPAYTLPPKGDQAPSLGPAPAVLTSVLAPAPLPPSQPGLPQPLSHGAAPQTGLQKGWVPSEGGQLSSQSVTPGPLPEAWLPAAQRPFPEPTMAARLGHTEGCLHVGLGKPQTREEVPLKMT